MPLDFKALKKKSTTNIADLTKALDSLNKNSPKGDDRFWKPTTDKAGNGYAIIRFLPAPAVDGDEGLPWVRIFDHFFKGPTGRWYVENSLTTLGQNDPVSEYNSRLWNSGLEANKEIARKYKRRLGYFSNIRVVKDERNPEAEGKEFLFRYGKKIMDKIGEKMNPQYEGEEAANPFDFWTGMDFKLKITKVAGFPNYDKSEFAAPSVIGGLSDKEIEKIWKAEYSLRDFLAPSQFKSYAELKQKFTEVIGSGAVDLPESVEDAGETFDNDEQSAVVEAPTKAGKSTRNPVPVADDDGEDTSFFDKLAEDDGEVI